MGTQLHCQKWGTGPQFSAHVHCGQTAGWMKLPVWYGVWPQPWRHCVRWGLSSPLKGAQQPPHFGPCLLWPNVRPSQLLLSTCCECHQHASNAACGRTHFVSRFRGTNIITVVVIILRLVLLLFILCLLLTLLLSLLFLLLGRIAVPHT